MGITNIKDNSIIKQYCKKLGLTQKQLAKEIGVTETTISQWARGAVPVPKWGLKSLHLLEIKQQYKIIKSFFSSLE